jgi:hypothetical protein
MQLQREAMYILIACTWVKIPPQNIIGIKGINLCIIIFMCSKMMSKNVKCGKIITSLGEEGIWMGLNLLMFLMAYILLSYGINIA